LNIEVEIPVALKETDHLCGHIGAAGYYAAPMEKFLFDYRMINNDLQVVEDLYRPDIFNWNI
jgi:hypothetical protein